MFGVLKDPVCKASVKKNTPYKYEFDSKIYYFDSAACKRTFIDNPEEFIKTKKEKRVFKEPDIEIGCGGKCGSCLKNF